MNRIRDALRALLHWLRTSADADNPYRLDPVDEHFTTAPGEEPLLSGDGVPVVPGDWTAELHDAYDDYRAGVDIFAGARHEPSPEVKQ